MEGKFIEIKEYTEEGYKPVIDFESWRVAVLNYCDELLPEEITNIQKHDESDEAFILLSGKCILFIYDEHSDKILGYDMVPKKIYNIKKSTYHTHTLTKDAMVLIVENQNTSDDNSPKLLTRPEWREQFIRITGELWK